MAICITKLCNGGIFSFYIDFLIAIHHFQHLCYILQDQQCRSCQTEVTFTQTDDLQQGFNFPTLQKIHSGRLGVKSSSSKEVCIFPFFSLTSFFFLKFFCASWAPSSYPLAAASSKSLSGHSNAAKEFDGRLTRRWKQRWLFRLAFSRTRFQLHRIIYCNANLSHIQW